MILRTRTSAEVNGAWFSKGYDVRSASHVVEANVIPLHRISWAASHRSKELRLRGEHPALVCSGSNVQAERPATGRTTSAEERRPLWKVVQK